MDRFVGGAEEARAIAESLRAAADPDTVEAEMADAQEGLEISVGHATGEDYEGYEDEDDEEDLVDNYNPNRHPKGTRKGGQFASGQPAGGVAGGTVLPDPAKVKIIGPAGGSTGAKFVEDEHGTRWVMKTGKKGVETGKGSEGHLRSEAMADKAYRAAGVPVPDGGIVETPGGPVKFTKVIKGQTLDQWEAGKSEEEIKTVHAKIAEHFATDALMANWDVIGLTKDNILVGEDGIPYRIDNGGALNYRAQGSKKGAKFTDTVGELDTLKSYSLNPSAASVFNGTKGANAGVEEQIHGLLAKKDSILAAVDDPEVRAKLAKRFDSLAEKVKVKPAGDNDPPKTGAAIAAKAKDDLADKALKSLGEDFKPGDMIYPSEIKASMGIEWDNLDSKVSELVQAGVLKKTSGNALEYTGKKNQSDQVNKALAAVDSGAEVKPPLPKGIQTETLAGKTYYKIDGDPGLYETPEKAAASHTYKSKFGSTVKGGPMSPAAVAAHSKISEQGLPEGYKMYYYGDDKLYSGSNSVHLGTSPEGTLAELVDKGILEKSGNFSYTVKSLSGSAAPKKSSGDIHSSGDALMKHVIASGGPKMTKLQHFKIGALNPNGLGGGVVKVPMMLTDAHVEHLKKILPAGTTILKVNAGHIKQKDIGADIASAFAEAAGPKPGKKVKGAYVAKKTYEKLDIDQHGVQAYVEAHSEAALKIIGSEVKSLIRSYTGTFAYTINSAMMKCPPEFECVKGELREKMVKMLEGFDKIPPFDKPIDVRRGISVSPQTRQKLVDAANDALANGGLFPMPAFTSTSIKKGFSGNVKFHIKALTGIYVEKFTKAGGEYEVLQSPRAKYRVLKVVTDPEKGNEVYSTYYTPSTAHIYLEEIL